MKIKGIETITKSEQKKAIRYFEKKHPGTEVIASGWATNRRSESDIETGFQTVSVELWNEAKSESYTVYLSVCLWDRRRSFVMEDAENWYREPAEEATTHTINNNEEENTMTTNTIQTTTDFEIENRLDDIAECDEILGTAEAEAVHEAKFEIGSKYERTGLYGSSSTLEVVRRTETTVFFRSSWVSEDSWKLCHGEPKEYPIEVERVGNVDVERVEIWEYRGAKGYIYAASEEERDSFREEAKKEAEPAEAEEATEEEEQGEEIAEAKSQKGEHTMKKSMLTADTLDRFEEEFETEHYTEDELRRIEHSAFAANMNKCANPDWSAEDIFADFLRVLGIEKIEVVRKATETEEITEEELDEAIAEEVEKDVSAEMKVEEILEKVEQTKTRSAWDRGVKEYALELLDDLGYGVRHGYIEADELENRRLLEKAMLNGASDWKQYSEGGCALCYDGKIAERLCAPWELRKTENGRKDPNPRESWIDVQSRALYQAAQMILRVAF